MSSWEKLEDHDTLLDITPESSQITKFCCGKWRRVNIILSLTAVALIVTALICISLRTSEGNKLTPPMLQVLLPNNTLQTTTPFMEPFPDDSNTNSSGRSWKSLIEPPEYSAIFEYVQEIISIFTSNATSSGSNSVQEPVEVTIYYEVLSKSSREFLTHQFFPTFAKLSLYIKPILIPYGNTNSSQEDGNKGITLEGLHCNHGFDECQGNLVHACAIKHTQLNDSNSVGLLMGYIGCMVSDLEILNPKADDIGQKCARFAKVDWNTIYTCTQNGEGLAVLGKYRELTQRLSSPRPLSLPIVMVEDKRFIPTKSVVNPFFNYLCTEFLSNEPSECTATTTTAKP